MTGNLDWSLLEIDIEIWKSIISVVITTVVTGVAGHFLIGKPKVKWGVSHGFAFNLRKETEDYETNLIYTQSLFIQNMGRKPAHEIEVHLNFPPEHFQTWPSFDYQTITTPQGQFVIKIGTLGKHEHLTIEMVQGRFELPRVLYVRTPEGPCLQMSIAPQPVAPTWLKLIVTALMLIGLWKVVEMLVGYFI